MSCNHPRTFWDLLAPCWHLLEHGGLTPERLSPLLEHLSDPVLLVGAGQGLLVPPLRQHFKQVHAVDQSVEMAHRARQRRGVEVVVADGTRLPYPDATFGSALLATGVVDGSERGAATLRASLRAIRPGGRVLVALYAPSRSDLVAARRVGLVEGQLGHRARRFELWRARPDAWPELVARWTGRSALEPRDMRPLWAVRRELDALAACLTRQGRDAAAVLREAYRAPVPFFDPDGAAALCDAHGLEPIDATQAGDTLLILAQSR